MSERNLTIVTKIIGYYCAFYFGVKVFAVLQGNPFGKAHLIIGVVLFLIAFASFYLLKKQQQNWGFVIFGVVVVSALRYYEPSLLEWLQGVL